MTLLDRDLSRAVTTPVRSLGGPSLRAVVDEGVRIFERCWATARGADENLGVLFPFLHLIEMLDGTEILLDHGATAPAQVTLRAAFEALLSLQHITASDTSRRGAAYVVAEIHARLAGIDRFDPSTQRGKQLLAAFRKDEQGSKVTLPAIEQPEAKRDGKLSLLAQPHLREAADAYEEAKKKLRRAPPFYALWGGPTDLEQLAGVLNRAAQYEILYRQWSNSAHGTDLSRQLRDAGGQAGVSCLRNGENAATIYSLAISYGLDAIRYLLGYYRPDEIPHVFGAWYRDQVSPGYVALGLVEEERVSTQRPA